jgi:hypothetical protein
VFGQPSSQLIAPASLRSTPPSGDIVLLGYFAEQHDVAAEYTIGLRLRRIS